MFIGTIAAQEVVVGDEVYNSGASLPYRWVRVKKVYQSEGRIVLETIYWNTWKLPAEGVLIRRMEENSND